MTQQRFDLTGKVVVVTGGTGLLGSAYCQGLAEHGAQVSEVALNWCRAHGAMPIPGLRTPEQAEAAAAALSWQLDGQERLALDRQALALPVRMPANPFLSD